MNLFETLLNEVLEEKLIKVRHSRPKPRKKAKLFKHPNQRKIKRKKVTMKLRKPVKRLGFAVGADGRLHKVVHIKARKR